MNTIRINGEAIDLDVLLAPPQDDTIVRFENGLVAMNYDTFNKLYRPKGEWIKSEQNPNELYCSECRGIHNDKTGKWRETFTYKYAFCPLCGADMRGKE